MRFRHTNRPGFWLGFIDFFTAGLFFLLYMPLGGLQDELDEILGRKTQRYWVAYILGIPTLFVYTLVWMSRIAEELKAKAIDLGIDGPYTSWWHMFGWNVFGLPLMGPAVATWRFFDTLNKIERCPVWDKSFLVTLSVSVICLHVRKAWKGERWLPPGRMESGLHKAENFITLRD